jgi:hypothetical protein
MIAGVVLGSKSNRNFQSDKGDLFCWGSRRSQFFGKALAGDRVGAQPEYLPIGGIKLVLGSFESFFCTILVATK